MRPEGQMAEKTFGAVFCAQVAGADTQPRQMAAHCPDIWRDGHLIIIQDDDQRLAAVARVVERLVSHAAGERPVADDRDHVVFLVLERPGVRHPQGG